MRARGLLALVAALHAGCASLPPQVPPAPDRAALGRVAIVAGSETPQIHFEGFARSKGEGAAAGAGGVFLSCVASMGPAACGGTFCGAVAVLWLGFCGVAGAVGGVAGAASAASADTVRSAETALRARLDVTTIQESLRRQIDIAAREREVALAALSDADSLLEVTLVRAGTTGGGINAPVELQMVARIRVLRAADRAELYRAQMQYLGEAHPIVDWAADEGVRLLAALNGGYQALAAQIADNVFLLYPFPDRRPGSAGTLAVSFGLEPVYPRTRGTLSGDRLIGDYFEWTQVDSRQPTLRWQTFPRALDVAAAPAEMARVSRVSYDLVIARERNLAAAEVVYRRSGLGSTEHRLEAPLEANARFFWTVRARFTLDGATRVTGWSSTHFVARERVTAPSRYSYRFRTP